MKRREFLLLGWAMGMLPNHAQQTRTARIGFLGAATESGWAAQVGALRAGLRELGYFEGKNLAIEFRWANGQYDRLPELAAELVRLNVDVLVTQATLGTRAAERATTTIPIVIAAVGDAVASGLIKSLAKPGGNVTGSSFFIPELAAKRLELLKEVLPQAKRVGMLFNLNAPSPPVLDATARSAKLLNIELRQYGVRDSREFAGAFQDMASDRNEAVLMNEDPMLLTTSREIAALAASQRLPSFGFKELVKAGGLVAYGADIVEMHRHAAVFVDKILKGAKPGDLPVEQPTKFELIINQTTAKTLGLEMPPMLLNRADEIIG
jgi:putative tryptophan/tyrosine transport system substrate-binding protein